MKLDTAIKMSDGNRDFLSRLNHNCHKKDFIMRDWSYSDLMSAIENYFKLNNDRYVELVELIGNMEGKKNGIK
jgi:hypothetical protein